MVEFENEERPNGAQPKSEILRKLKLLENRLDKALCGRCDRRDIPVEELENIVPMHNAVAEAIEKLCMEKNIPQNYLVGYGIMCEDYSKKFRDLVQKYPQTIKVKAKTDEERRQESLIIKKRRKIIQAMHEETYGHQPGEEE